MDADATSLTRVLILTADVGEGHVAAGRALRERLVERAGVAVELRDGLALLGGPAQRIIRDGYRRQLELAPWAYNLSYTAWRCARPLQLIGGELLYRAGRRSLAALIAEQAPDVIVSTHPALTAALGQMRLRGRLDAAVCAVITDLTDNPMWSHRGVDRHIVMHEVARPWVQRHVGDGVVAACPPVSPRFTAPADRDEVRARLGVAVDQTLVVVSGGGWGVGALADGADAALRAGADHVIVLAGRNDHSRAELTDRYRTQPRLQVLGFTDRMADLLVGADALVHSTGGVTSLEALTCGCPLIGYGTELSHVREHYRTLAGLGLCQVAADPPALEAMLRTQLAGARVGPRSRPELAALDCAEAVLSTVRRERRPRAVTAQRARLVRRGSFSTEPIARELPSSAIAQVVTSAAAGSAVIRASGPSSPVVALAATQSTGAAACPP